MNRVEDRLERVETAVLDIAKTTTEIKESVADHGRRITRLEEVPAK